MPKKLTIIFMEISKNIKKIRSFKGISQQAFAELFDLTRASVSAYEDGRAKPKMEILIQIAKKFNIPLEVFLKEELTINQLAHFGNQVEQLSTSLKLNAMQFEVYFVSGSIARELLDGVKDAIDGAERIIFPLPIVKAEYAFQIVEDIFNNSIQGIGVDDILFCSRQKGKADYKRGYYLLQLANSFVCAEFNYDNDRKCFVNANNSLEKIFTDEIVEVYKVRNVLSGRLFKAELEDNEAQEMRKTLKRLDKYLKL
jgi:transcriptional regulator with XRE-family HTH domain